MSQEKFGGGAGVAADAAPRSPARQGLAAEPLRTGAQDSRPYAAITRTLRAEGLCSCDIQER